MKKINTKTTMGIMLFVLSVLAVAWFVVGYREPSLLILSIFVAGIAILLMIFKNKLKKCFAVIAGLALILMLVHTSFNIYYTLMVKQQINKLKKEGKPVNIAEAVPKSVKDKDNAALIYNKVFMLMSIGDYKINSGGRQNNTLNVIQNVGNFYDISKWTPKQKKEVPELVNSKEMQYIYSLLEKATERKQCRFDIKYQDGMEALLFHLNFMRGAIRCLAVKALLESQAGKEQAFDTILTALKVGNSLKQEPYLISQLVRIACDSISLKSLQAAMQRQQLSVEMANKIMNELTFHTSQNSSWLNMERVMGLWAYNKIREDSGFAEYLLASGGVLKELVSKNYGSYIFRPLLNRDCFWSLKAYSEIEEIYKLPYYKVKDKLATTYIDERIPVYCPVATNMLGGLASFMTKSTICQAQIEACRIGLALNIYKIKHANYPEKLSDLTPEILPTIPLDPFTGKGFIYKKKNKGFIVYSLGPNMLDDNGISLSEANYIKGFDVVWKNSN